MYKIAPKVEISELIERANYDLQVREELVQKGELTKYGYHPKMQKIHEDNLLYLTKFLSRYGWPRPSKYGSEAFEAAWIISIHAIAKKEQMKEALIAIKALLDEGEKVAYQYACLYDRIALYEGRKQRYGTQLFPSQNGLQALDLEDQGQVDKYRTSLGLPCLAEKIQEFVAGGELGYIENELEEKRKFEEWLQQSDWRKI
jgi:hypothetical protein